MKEKRTNQNKINNQILPKPLQGFLEQFANEKLILFQKLDNTEHHLKSKIIESFWENSFEKILTNRDYKDYPITVLRKFCRSIYQIISHNSELVNRFNRKIFDSNTNYFALLNMKLNLLLNTYDKSIVDKGKWKELFRLWKTHNITKTGINVGIDLTKADWGGDDLRLLPENFEFWFTELLPIWLYFTKDNLRYFYVTLKDSETHVFGGTKFYRL